MMEWTNSNPIDWTWETLEDWLDKYENGKFKPLSKQLRGFSGRQIISFSDYQWFHLRPEELANSFRYTFFGMCTVYVGKEYHGGNQFGMSTKVLTTTNPSSLSKQVAVDNYQEISLLSSKVPSYVNPPKSIPVGFPPWLAVPSKWFMLMILLLVVFFVLAGTVWKRLIAEHWKISTKELLEFASIPIISVIFTYLHIWLALWMTFYPLEFRGLGQFGKTNVGVLGWQGIIPNKAEKMARTSVQMMTTQLMDVNEVFGRIDPKVVARELEPILYNMIKDIIEAMANKYNPSLWSVLPYRVKDEIIEKIKEESPLHIERMMNEIKSNITQVFDLEDMVVSNMMKDKQLLVNMFITCGYSELCFIRNAGAYMGGIFGVLQMILWIFYKERQVVFPVFGVCVGTLTNWLALKMIFQPINPRKCCCWTIHGLFLQRQYQVAAEYGKMVARDVLNSRNIIQAILKGPASDKLFEIVFNNVKQSVDGGVSVTEKIVALSIGKDTYQSIKDDICHMVVDKFPDGLWYIEDYTEDALDLEVTLRDKMRELSFEQFEGLLHPVFQEDEWKLVVMGGALGLLIALLQAYVINV